MIRNLQLIVTSHPLLSSKFFPPPLAARWVKRADLVARIEAGLDALHPLTLVSAPAGYGKTAIVAEWAQRSRRPVTWLALDESDNEPLRFFMYFIAALQKVHASIGVELMALLQSNQLPPRETLVTLLINDLIESKTLPVCVLDDFQSIQEEFILDVLQEIILRLRHPLHLMIVTRDDPAMPLGRLRAHAQLTEIRAADLRFTKKEINHFFRDIVQIQLSESAISLLDERTEGWVAGLQLVGISIQGHAKPESVIASLSGSQRHILSYLTEEVLKQQLPSVQEFLLQTSILAKFSADLCNAVTRQGNGEPLLRQLFTSNLFLIPLDDHEGWYRYHHLFAGLLFNILKRTALPEKIRELHERASQWFESENMPVEAIDHALGAEDFGRAASLLEEHTWALLNQGYVRRVEAWMQSLPLEWRAQSPRTNLGIAWMYLLRGNFGLVMPFLQQAEAALERIAANDDLRAECLALKANLLQSQGKITEAIDDAQQALKIVPVTNVRVLGLAYLGLGAGYRQNVQFDLAVDALQQASRASRMSGDSVTGALAATHLILMCLQHGRLRFAEEVSSQMIERMEHSAGAVAPIIGAVYGALGLVYYERNQIEMARDHYLRGIQLGTFLGHHASLVYTQLNLARLLLAEGDLEGAAKNLHNAQELIQAGAPGWLRPGLIAGQVQYFLSTGNLPQAEAVLRQSGVTPGGQVTHAADEIQLAHLRLMLRRATETDLKEGIQLAGRILSLAESGQRSSTSLQALVLGALLHERLGDARSACAWMERAVGLAEPERYIRLFVDEGAAVVPILQRLAKTEYAGILLAACPAGKQSSAKPHPEDGLIEPLSERELEVLRLLAHGLKYTEIAGQLVISVNTVRYHIKSIYAKLSVDKQAKAVERGRDLGLIE